MSTAAIHTRRSTRSSLLDKVDHCRVQNTSWTKSSSQDEEGLRWPPVERRNQCRADALTSCASPSTHVSDHHWLKVRR
ncbi:hypothetical protein C8Q76DRAFT_70034 [Earliella scabrosa]|nr:hypothetical protein C8Q76DRAFT_70034 [Earliella scabrosa]